MGYYSSFRIRNARLSYEGTKKISIYVLSSGKFLDVRKYTCVKDLTKIMSGPAMGEWGEWVESCVLDY